MRHTSRLALLALLLTAFAAGRWSQGMGLIAEAARPLPAPLPASLPALLPATAPLALGAYRATVTRVMDGDTVEARVPVWLGQEILTKIRLRGIDAPEISGACGEEKELAVRAAERLKALIGDGPVTLSAIGPDKYYGRVVAHLTVHRGEAALDAGEVLLREGLARAYDGKRREAWCGLR